MGTPPYSAWEDVLLGVCLPAQMQLPIPLVTGLNVEKLRRSRPTRYRYTKPPTVTRTALSRVIPPPRPLMSLNCYNNLVIWYYNLIYNLVTSAKWQTAGIKFTDRPKISIFAQQGRLVAPTHVKLVRTTGHLGPLGHKKIHANRFTGVGKRPQNIKNFYFLVKTHLAET